jgi:hypothetical protein
VAFHYDLVVSGRNGGDRARAYASDVELRMGDVVRLEGRDWLVDVADEERLHVVPARYRLRLHHPNGSEEAGVVRRWRPDAPRVGHYFSTFEGGRPVTWQVVSELLAHDGDGSAYLALLAQRDYSEDVDTQLHELEHARQDGDGAPPEAAALFRRAEAAGLAVELVALDAGDEADWDEAAVFIDALTLDEIAEYLLQICGVDLDHQPRPTWLETVKDRLGEDLSAFRGDVEGEHAEIEEWEFRDGRIFASTGTTDDEARLESGHGWMCRLLDSEALGAAGFKRVRRSEL